MKLTKVKTVLLIGLVALALSISLAAVSLYPGGSQSYVLDSTFTLTPGETYEQGLGIHTGEEVTLSVTQSPASFQENFTLIKPNANDYVLTDIYVAYSIRINSSLSYTFTAAGSSYEAVFAADSPQAGTVIFHASVQRPNDTVGQPYSWLNQPARIIFYASLGVCALATLAVVLSTATSQKPSLPSISKRQLRWLAILLVISTVVWFSFLAVNNNPLATLASWYTDNGRDSYVASLFLKDGFHVFSQPLGKLANLDNSPHKFVTWPETPHLYPLGSIFLFLPFGALLQDGLSPSLIYKIEVGIFLIFATVGVYFFLKYYFQKDMALLLRLFGVYVIYVSLVVYAGNGEFDAVAFLFALFAIFMFVAERYDYFFLLFAISFFFKYQTGIFLFPLVIVGLIRLLKTNPPRKVLTNKAVIAGAAFGVVSLYTASLSAPYFLKTTPQLVSNGINIFSDNLLIPWSLQTLSIFTTLAVTVAYALYMLNKNSLLSFSALFLLLPSFMLPYFQIWYMPFVFVYALIPQRRNELEATTLWLLFLIVILAVSGSNYEPVPLLAHYLQGQVPIGPASLSIPQSLKGFATAAFT